MGILLSYSFFFNQIYSKLQHINNCDLEDEQMNDAIHNKIKRWNEFREMVFKDMVNFFHDEKDIVLSTHKKIKVSVIKKKY